MDLGLYLCGVGYIHIPTGYGSTKLYSTFLGTNFPHKKYVCEQILQNIDNHSLLTHYPTFSVCQTMWYDQWFLGYTHVVLDVDIFL